MLSQEMCWECLCVKLRQSCHCDKVCTYTQFISLAGRILLLVVFLAVFCVPRCNTASHYVYGMDVGVGTYMKLGEIIVGEHGIIVIHSIAAHRVRRVRSLARTCMRMRYSRRNYTSSSRPASPWLSCLKKCIGQARQQVGRVPKFSFLEEAAG